MQIEQKPDERSTSYVNKLVYIFALVYFSQGFTGTNGVICQPISFYIKESLGLKADTAVGYLAILTIPWMLKPLYGLISDYIPLLGYRRKTWLILMNIVCVVGLIFLMGAQAIDLIVIALALRSLGAAASDVIIDAVMVENGKIYNAIGKFQSIQWCWLNIALLVAALLGGYLCTIFSPREALRVGAGIAIIAPLLVIISSHLILREEKKKIDLKEMRETTRGLGSAFKSKTLWFAALFLVIWKFTPSFGLPLYYYLVNDLEFAQNFIGTLSAIGYGGSICGALVYGFKISKFPLKNQLLIGIIAGTLGHISYLLYAASLNSYIVGSFVSFLSGATDLIAKLAVLNLVARACPKGAEGFTFAFMMALSNGSLQLAALFGSWAYVRIFSEEFLPLVILSSVFSFSTLIFIPILNSQIAQVLQEKDEVKS